MDAQTVAVLREAAAGLREAARSNHRAAGQLKRRAREGMQRLAAFEEQCARLGVEIPREDTHAQGGTSAESQPAGPDAV